MRKKNHDFGKESQFQAKEYKNMSIEYVLELIWIRLSHLFGFGKWHSSMTNAG